MPCFGNRSAVKRCHVSRLGQAELAMMKPGLADHVPALPGQLHVDADHVGSHQQLFQETDLMPSASSSVGANEAYLS